MITASMDEKQEIERLWDDEEDNLKHEIESFWVEEEEAYGGFASDNLQGNHRFETGNQRIDAGEFHNFEDSGCRRIVLSPGFNLQVLGSLSFSLSLSDLSVCVCLSCSPFSLSICYITKVFDEWT